MYKRQVYIGADGQHIEIRVENTLIRGSVQVTKTEAVEAVSYTHLDVYKRQSRSRTENLHIILPINVYRLAEGYF